MKSTFIRMVRCLLAAAVVASTAGAAEPAGTPPPKPAPKLVERVTVEGRGLRELREQHLEAMRQSVDPTLDRAVSRYQAFLARENAELRGPVPTLPAWQPFGPAPINGGQTPTNSPRFPSDVSGRTVAIAFDEINDDVYIGAAQGGIWRSSDNGSSWTVLTDTLASTAVGAIAVVPPALVGDPATIYYGTGESSASCDSYAGVGLYKSTDGGATWTGPIQAADFANRAIASLAVDRTNSDHLILTTSSGIFGSSCVAAPTLPDRGIFRSVDAGLTWTKETPSNWRFATVVQDPQVATTWWAGGRTSGGSIDPANEGGLWKSTDNGDTWTQQAGAGGLPALSVNWGRTWVTATTDTNFPGHSILFFGNGLTATGAGQGSVFKTVDSGATWAEVTAARGYCNAQCFYDNPVYVEPGEEQIFYTGGAGASTVGVLPTQFMRTNNGGTTFADKVRSGDATNALHADVHFIASWPGEPNRLWVTNDGGVWRSDDRGDNWVNVNSNLQTTQFTGCDLHPTDGDRLYAGSQDNGTQGREVANNWKHLDFGDGGYSKIDQGDPDNLVHTYFNQTNNLVGVGFTTGGFATTMGLYNGSFAPANGIPITERVRFYAPIHLDRGNSDTLYYGTNRLWRAPSFFVTGGLGGEFSAVNAAQDLTGGTIGSGAGGALTAIETFANPIANTDAQLIYTGSSNGIVFRTTDGGTIWTQVDVGGSALWVSDLLVDPADSGVVYQARSGFAGAAGLNVRKSINGGATWAPAGTGLPDIPVNALGWDPSVSNRLWAGTDVGAFYTTDGGASWTAYNNNLPATAIVDLAWNPDTGKLVACTHGRGSFVLDFQLFADGFEDQTVDAWTQCIGNCPP